MAGFGKRKRVNRTVDLTRGGRFTERRPSERGEAHDIRAHAGQWTNRQISGLRGRVARLSKPGRRGWAAGIAVVPSLVALVICVAGRAPGAAVGLVCLGVAVASGAVAVAFVRCARRATRMARPGLDSHHGGGLRPQQPVKASAPVKKGAASAHADRRRRRKKGGGGGKNPRGRRS